MGIFPTCFKQHKLIVDETYLMGDGKKIKEVKLIQSTEKGFNFIDANEKLIFKKHLYPQEIVRKGMKEFTFWIPKDIVVNPIGKKFQYRTVVDIIKDIPQQPQVQYDLNKQLEELRIAANKLGLFDAADYLRK